MSLLGTQVYANSTTPLWLGTAGATSGDLTVGGTLFINNDVDFKGDTGTLEGRITAGQSVNNTLYIQTTGRVDFTQIGTGSANTYVQVSPFGSGGDQLVVGGTVSANKLALPTAGAAPTAGVSAIPAGNDNVVVPTTAVTANSIILVTRMGDQAAGPGIGSGQMSIMVPSTRIIPGVSFEAYLVNPMTGIVVAANTVNAGFSWCIIN